ncbi:MAG TPA: phage holin family protein [Armatimonadota bacterium]|nr:phage holin family protein [Armatimonadota bacterium]
MLGEMRQKEFRQETRVAGDGLHQANEKSLGELFSDLAKETSTLVRQEVNLARAEMTDKLARMAKGAGLIAAGGVLAFAGLLAIVAVLIIALAIAIPWWASALIVGFMLIGAGGFLGMTGMVSLKQLDMAPRQTIETLKDDAQWAKDQTK